MTLRTRTRKTLAGGVRRLGRLIGVYGRDLSRYPRYWIRHVRRPDRVRLHGVELPVGPDLPSILVDDLYAERYERTESRSVLVHLEPDDIVLELGAGSGYLAALCALRVGSRRVFTVEANRAVLPRIRETWQRNGVTPTLVHGILGNGGSFEAMPVFVSSSAAAGAARETGSPGPRIDVRDLMDEIRPTFVLMDVEGSEKDLVPAIDWSGVRVVLLEVHPARIGETAARDVLRSMEKAGFVPDRSLSTRRKKVFVRPRSS